MLRKIVLTLAGIGLAFGLLACQSDDVTGPVTLNEDDIPTGVYGYCENGSTRVNGITCKVYLDGTGIQVFNTNISHCDPVQGDGFYNCTSAGDDPAEGDALIVKGFKNGQPWGESEVFPWTPPYASWKTVTKY